MWAWEGGWPDGTDTQIINTYYAGLWDHLEKSYGYRKGVDMFAAPYDWRMDFDGLNQVRWLLLLAGCCGVRTIVVV